MTIFHNSHDEKYRNPFGAVHIGTEMHLTLEVSPLPKEVFLHYIVDGEKEEVLPPHDILPCENKTRYKWTFKKDTVGLVWYYFSVSCKSGAIYYYGNNADFLGGEGAVCNRIPPAFQITFYEPINVPKWYSDGIIYQIFPDRFHRGEDHLECFENSKRDHNRGGARRFYHVDWNDKPFYTKTPSGDVTRWGFFGGTLKGIEEKLLYIKNLGVSTIYLNPIFEAASNHKYDTGNYLKIDKGFGDEESFKSLVESAKALGINIMLDGVFSHTGADSVYFNKYANYDSIGATQGSDSKYSEWYHFRNFPYSYDAWWGVSDLPNIIESTESYREFLFGEKGVIPYWLSLGAKGIRLDVADELPDSFIEELTATAKKCDSEAVILGEVWEDASYKESYGERRRYVLGRELDSIMNYPFRNALVGFALGEINAYRMGSIIMSLRENYPKEIFDNLMNLLGTHDTERLLTVLGVPHIPQTPEQKEFCKLSEQEYSLAKKRLKMLVSIQFASPGIPSIYYGDEAGLEGWSDPYNRSTYPWGKEDYEILDHYKAVSHIRKVYTALNRGSFEPATISPDIYAFWRVYKDEAIFIVSNRSSKSHRISVDIKKKFGKTDSTAINLFSSQRYDIKDGTLELEIAEFSTVLVCVNINTLPKASFKRGAGILCHLTSLIKEGKDLKTSAFEFIDYLKEAGQIYWQILPLNPVDGMGSPYATSSVFAGNDSMLNEVDEKALAKEKGYAAFCKKEDYWLSDYALFCSIKATYNGKQWQEWDEKHKNRTDVPSLMNEFKSEVESIKIRQYAFWKMWDDIHNYAKSQGIEIIGDMPIYVSSDSSDVWAAKHLFTLNEKGYPRLTAGVPPDYFSEDGQGWGNPLYDFKEMEKDGYLWWKRRFIRATSDFDIARLDHFRAFASYYCVEEGKSARYGFWEKGVGKEFFKKMYEELGTLPIIAEDLGIMDSSVYDLMGYTGFPGMNIFQFHRDEMKYMPDDVARNRIFFSGSHDNQSLRSWCADNGYTGDYKNYMDDIIKDLYSSKSQIVIIPMQDVLYLDDSSRMNTPGVAEGNWTWTLPDNALKSEDAKRLKKYTENRI